MSNAAIKFPDRVWYETDKGWADRPATKADHERRAEIAERLNLQVATR